MNRIEVGEVYIANKHRTGTSRNGNWELFTVRDEKGKNEISVYAENLPNKGFDGCKFKLTGISEVKNGMKKGSDERWYPNVSVTATVDVLESDLTADGGDNPFTDLDDDGDLPWNELPL